LELDRAHGAGVYPLWIADERRRRRHARESLRDGSVRARLARALNGLSDRRYPKNAATYVCRGFVEVTARTPTRGLAAIPAAAVRL